MKFIPNIITCLRILASLLILFVPNKWFFPLYFFAGLTDMLDGWLARKMSWTSPFGTFLDSLADLLFFLVVIAKVVLTITLPAFLLWGALTVALIRCISYVIGYFRFHQFTSLHTYLNKLTGLLLFFITDCIINRCNQALWCHSFDLRPFIFSRRIDHCLNYSNIR